MEQRTIEWFRIRLGKITGSEVGKLMGKGRKKEDLFSATGKTYINEKATERAMNPNLVELDEWMEEYIKRNDITTKAMQYGIDNEPCAKAWFTMRTGIEIQEEGSVVHPDIPCFAASPDGLCEVNGKKMVVEVKCPAKAKYAEYCSVVDGATLKDANDEYYWQMQAEMACTGAEGGLFMAYRDDQVVPLHVAVIERNEEDIAQMVEKVKAADELINEKVAMMKEFKLEELFGSGDKEEEGEKGDK